MADAQASANGATGGSGGNSSSSSANAADSCRTVLVIDGAYAHIGARSLEGNRIDYIKFRSVLETLAGSRLRECWFFDQEPILQRSSHQGLSAQYTALKLAPPHGPQFQLKLYAMKKYQCHCKRCGHQFHQMVQKGVDNGIATKILSLAYENICDRFILFAGDGDFYDSLNQIKNVLRKDLWVIGYRDTVSADLQQLASHVIWINDLWSEIRMPGSGAPATTAGSNGNGNGKPARHELGEEDGELSDCEAPRPRKRGKERQVQVTSQKPQTAPRDKQQRRDRSRSRQRPDLPQPPAEKKTVSITLPVAAMTLASAPLRDSHYGPGDAHSSRAERKVLRVKRKRNGESNSKKPDEFGREMRPSQRPGILGAPPGPAAASKGSDKDALSRRIPVAPVTFTMSDISSSDDDDNRIPNAPPPGGKRKNPQVIDLASDSDTSSD